MIKKIFLKLGIDGAIAFTLLSRVVQALGGLGSVIFIGVFLNDIERGYFYTFASIISIQVFFELGLSGIITQYAAHEFAHLQWADNAIIGDKYYQSRLSSLLRFSLKWFGIISILLFFLLSAAGFYFFSRYNNSDNVNWQTPWLILCIATSLNLFIDPILAFIDGLGEIKDMARVRLVQKTTFVILLFAFFACGFKLYASPLASLTSILVNYIQILFSARIKKLTRIWNARGSEAMDYMAEIFPYQWRLAISWMSSYFIFQLFNPVLFAVSGAAVAGQMGMSLQILNGITNLSMSWIITKVPTFSTLIAQKSFTEADTLFDQTLRKLMFVNVAALTIFYLLLIGLNFTSSPFSYKFLPLLPLLLLCLVNIGNQFVFSWSTYLRCHKQEPFLLISVVLGLLCAASTVLLGNLYGLMGVIGGYSCISIIVGVPWAFAIFKRKIALWHGYAIKV